MIGGFLVEGLDKSGKALYNRYIRYTDHIRPWRSWITQRIPIPENGSSNLFGRAILIGIPNRVFLLFFTERVRSKRFEGDCAEI